MIQKPLILFGIAITMMSTAAAAKPLVYVAAGVANQIIVIDAATDKVVGNYGGIDNPHSVVSTPDGEYVLSGSLNETRPEKGSKAPPQSTIYLVHPVHGHVMLTMAAEGMIHHQAITPDGRYVISTHPTRGHISVADLQENRVVRTVKTGSAPNYAVVSNDGMSVYVSNSGSGTISVIDPRTWKVVRSLKAGPGPEHMALSRNGDTLYVANAGAGKVSAVDIAAGDVRQSFELGGKIHGLDISDDGSTLFISNRSTNELVALDPLTNVRRVVDLSPAPYHLGAIRGTGKVYVSSSTQPKLWVIDQKSARVTGEIDIIGVGHQMTTIN